MTISSGLAVYPSQLPPTPRTLVDILQASIASHPQALAIDNGKEKLTYTELAQDVKLKAEQLEAIGVGSGDRVGVRVTSGTKELYLDILAVLATGAAYVPVDVDDPDDRAEVVWTESGVCAVFTDGGLPKQRHAQRANTTSICRPSLDDDAWVIFTSGSTGKPKGVAVTHRSAAAFVDAEAQIFVPDQPIGPADRVLAGLSVAFDASCEEMWLAWRHGACLVPAPRSLVKAGEDLGAFLRAQRISVVSTVPTLAALWPTKALLGVRLLILGGEACPPDLAARLTKSVSSVWNTYGPTEATVVSCAAPLVTGKPVQIGLPLAGWDLAVVGIDGKPVRWGESGELVIGGVGLARYLDKAKDSEKFASLPALGWKRVYRSGDQVLAEAEGLTFIGRNDEQIKLGGRRIELGEIDTALMTLPGVSAAASAVRRNETGISILVGYIVRDGGNTGSARATDRALLQQLLPRSLLPMLVVLNDLPVRTSGKIDRAALPWPPSKIDNKTANITGTGTSSWLAEQWRRVLGVPAQLESDFFDLGGSSLGAAQLASLLRERCTTLSVVDIYENPQLINMAARLDDLLGIKKPRPRLVLPTPSSAGYIQLIILLGLQTFAGLRWIINIVIFTKLGILLFGPAQEAWAEIFHVSWWKLLPVWLLFISIPGRVIVSACVVRLLTAGITSGKYPRGGLTHLRLWTAERFVPLSDITNIAGTHWCRRYARLLGCQVGTDAQIHTLPPLTGLASFGAGCAVEPEVDVAGWWLDGDILHIGEITIGPGSRVGSRAMLMPNSVVEPFTIVEPGTCVSSKSTIRSADNTLSINPGPGTAREGDTRWNKFRYTLSLLLLDIIPSLTVVPSLGLFLLLVPEYSDFPNLVIAVFALAIPTTILTALCYAITIVALIRFSGQYLHPGDYSWYSAEAWAAWLTGRLMWTAREALFPIYASLICPSWLRALGARVGSGVEISTVLVAPALVDVDDESFLADDVLLSPYELGAGLLRLGTSSVGSRSFVGNSGIVALEHAVPHNALIGVLGTAPSPECMKPGSAWLGRPTMSFPRRVAEPDPRRTFHPSRLLVLARALVESCRLIPLACSSLLAELVGLAMFKTIVTFGFGWAIASGGFLLLAAGIVACAIATLAKWLLTPNVKGGQQHPLWCSFVWRHELADTFVESLAAPWLVKLSLGTPLLNFWLRSLGAKIQYGVWCETYRATEPDLLLLDASATVNRGCVLQTHLFHDRVMRLDTLHLHAGATLGPHSIGLPDVMIGSGTTIGPSSLVMRGEHIPSGTRWLGNPVQPWIEE